MARPPHKVATGVPGGQVVIRHSRGTFTTLPDWWGRTGNEGLDSSTYFSYGGVRFPMSGAIAPDALLPVPYGAVRIGGTALKFGGNGSGPGGDIVNGWGVIAWSEGEIGGVDAFYADGQLLTQLTLAQTGSLASRTFTHYMGAPGDPTMSSGSDIFAGMNVSGFTSCAFTRIDLYRAPILGARWWALLPGGVDGGPTYEWAADIRGLLLYDPRGGGSTSYSNNSALIVRDILQRWKKLTNAELDDTSFGVAADAGFTCNIVFAAKTPIRDALAIVLQTCNGRLITSNGKTGLSLDVVNASPAVATLSEEDGDIWALKYEWLSARDRITRVAVSFFRPGATKPDVTPDLDDPGIALGTVPLRAIVVPAPGINTLEAAVVLRNYLFNSAAVTFRISGMMRGQGILLQEGQKIHLVTRKGVNADFLIEQLPTDASGFFSFRVKPYVEAVYGSTAISQGPPVVTVPPDLLPPPPPAAPRWVFSGTQGVSFDPPRTYTIEGPYGTARWTVTGDASHDGTKINDGILTAVAITTVPAVETIVDLDLGVGVTKAFGRFDFWTGTPIPAPSPSFTPGPVALVQYSDNGSTWVNALTSDFGNIDVTTFWEDAAVGGVYPSHVEIPSAIGAHRYWRFYFYGASVAVNVYEIQAQSFVDWIGDTPVGYELRTWTAFETPSPTQPVAVFIPLADAPSDSTPLLITDPPLGLEVDDQPFGGFSFTFTAALTTQSRFSSSVSAVPLYFNITALASGSSSTNRLVKFTGTAGSIGDSSITDDGTVVTLAEPTDVTEAAAPSVGAAGVVRLYADSTGHRLRVSRNGGAFVDMIDRGDVFSDTAAGLVPASGGGATNFLRADGSFVAPPGSGGTVTSVGLTMPSGFSVSGSPVTGVGTLAATLDAQSGAKALISPAGGGSGTPAFRAIVAGDVPTLNQDTTGAAGYSKQIPQNSQTASYTLVIGDSGKHISITTGGVTVPNSVFSAGNVVTIYNNSASNQTITQGASVTMYLAGSATTGNRTLAQRGICTVLCVAASTFVIAGGGLT